MLEKQLQQKRQLLRRGMEALEEMEGSVEGSRPRAEELAPDPVSWCGGWGPAVPVLLGLILFLLAVSDHSPTWQDR